MRLIKPEWVNHDKNPIFSIDIHPDGSKFATGGQGTDAGQVVIWNLLPLIDENAEQSETIPKQLCQLDNHSACVNCVRWSGDGTILASGGDDKIIMLWKRGKGPSAVFGNSGITKSTENWRCTTQLRGHSGDILDLSWAAQDRWLASSSVDNNIIVWDMHNLPTMVTILKGHTGLVKGVTWDPVGKYLASQSDDRTVRVWRTSDWTCESSITEPFEECGGTTHVLRLSWSPDGLYLVSAHAMNSGGPTAQIIEREGWKCDKDFVGHRKAVTCVRFHQSIMKRIEPTKKKQQQYCVLAVGSRDRSLSIWLTALQRPLVVVHDLFKDSILDLSWSRHRNILLACSTDGTIAGLMFSENELGTALSSEDKNLLYQRMYGKSVNINLNESSLDKSFVTEYAELLDMDENGSIAEQQSQSNNNAPKPQTQFGSIEPDAMPISTKSAPIPTSTPTKAIAKQFETRRADGKRRITPMFIPLSTEQDEVVTESPTALVAPAVSANTSPGLTAHAAFEKKMNEQMSKGEVLFDSGPIINAIESNNVSTESNSLAQPQPTKPNKAQLDNRLTKVAPAKTKGLANGKGTKTNNPADVDENTIRMAIRQNNISAGKAIPYTAVTVKNHCNVQIEVRNNFSSTPSGPISKVSGVSSDHRWETFIGSPVVNFCVCAKYVLICSLDCTLRFVDLKNGTSVMPILHMPGPAIQCVFSITSELCGVVTECGSIRVWNMTTQSILISTTCLDLFMGTATKLTVSYFHVSEAGVLYILLSNGCSYSYSKQLESWILLNSRDPIIRLGVSSLPPNPKKTIKTYPLGLVQSASQSLQPSTRNLQDSINITWQNAAKLTFIENQIHICISIQSPTELQYWYSVLGTHLAQYCDEKRIRVHLDDLLGMANPWMFVDGEAPKKELILGVEKHSILINILNELKKVPKWQRLYVEYSKQLREHI